MDGCDFWLLCRGEGVSFPLLCQITPLGAQLSQNAHVISVSIRFYIHPDAPFTPPPLFLLGPRYTLKRKHQLVARRVIMETVKFLEKEGYRLITNFKLKKKSDCLFFDRNADKNFNGVGDELVFAR